MTVGQWSWRCMLCDRHGVESSMDAALRESERHAPPLSSAEQAIVDRFESAPDPYTEVASDDASDDEYGVPSHHVEYLCEVMHYAYEAAATSAGWETQDASRRPWSKVPEPNKEAMRAGVVALLHVLFNPPDIDCERLDGRICNGCLCNGDVPGYRSGCRTLTDAGSSSDDSS